MFYANTKLHTHKHTHSHTYTHTLSLSISYKQRTIKLNWFEGWVTGITRKTKPIGCGVTSKDYFVRTSTGYDMPLTAAYLSDFLVNLPFTRSVCWLVGRSDCHNFLKWREVLLPCSYRSTYLFCFFLHFQYF